MEIDFYKELTRIAQNIENEDDKVILYSAAMQLVKGPDPVHEDYQSGNGYVWYTRYY